MDKKTWMIQGALADYEVYHQWGQYFIRYRDGKIKNGDYLPLFSERNPEKDANRILGNFALKKGLLAIVVGLSAFKVIEILKTQRNQNGGEILVFEGDAKLLNELKVIYPELLEELHVFQPGDEVQLKNFMDELSIEGLLGYRILPLARSYKLGFDFYAKLENIFKSVFATRFSDLLTRIEFEGKWILNSFLNLEGLLKAIPVKELFNLAQNQNALLVSSGPSLRKSLDWIKENQSKFFICCVDSAYRVLHRSGIKPHLIFSLDSQIYTYRHFQGLPSGKTNEFPVLYADMVANPFIIRNWTGNLITGMTAQYSDTTRTITPGCDFIEEKFLREPCGDIQSGGSVATSLFDLLRNMNFETITLIGQDLAFTNREIHCSGTHHTDIWISKNLNRFESLENINFRIIKKRHIVWGVSKKGNPLAEDYIFSIYRKWFEEAISTVPNRTINASFDGAIINGAEDIGIPPRDLTMEFIRKIVKTLFQESSSLINKNALVTFYKEILMGNPFENHKLGNQYSFLDRIGKKYYIKHLRTQLREEGYDSEFYLNLQWKERAIFWNFLKKSLTRTLAKLEN